MHLTCYFISILQKINSPYLDQENSQVPLFSLMAQRQSCYYSDQMRKTQIQEIVSGSSTADKQQSGGHMGRRDEVTPVMGDTWKSEEWCNHEAFSP